MENKQQEIVTTVYRSLSEIEEQKWDSAGKSTGLDHKFLNIVEQSKLNNLAHFYIHHQSHDASARANCYVVDFDFATTDQSLSEIITPIKTWFPKFMDFKVFELGLFTMIGDGFESTSNAESPCSAEAFLIKTIESMEVLGRECHNDFFLIRDIPTSQIEYLATLLKPYGYLPCSGFTNAVLYNQWSTFDAYLDFQNSKTRNKMRSALKLEEKFGIKVEVTKDFKHLSKEMERLWQNVNKNSKDYSREQLTADFFLQTQLNCPENSEVITLTYQGKLIAFMYNLIGDDDYIMLDWGVDYNFEHYKAANLYRAASLLSIKRMIELKKARLELGITNYTPKLFLSATLEPKAFFIKHKNDPELSEALARTLTDNIHHAEKLSFTDQAGNESEVDEQYWRDYIHQLLNGVTHTDVLHKAKQYSDNLQLKLAGLYGFYPEFYSGQYSTIKNEKNEDIILLGTNSYLGLNTDPRLIEAATTATQHYGTGCSGSPLLNGTLDLHTKLEKSLANLTNKQAALLCSTGYQTNLSALSAIADKDTLVLMDERNHRSLYDAVKLSGAQIKVYAHKDYQQLTRILQRNQNRPSLIVSDTVFSMEGTTADLDALVTIKKTFNSRLFLDESHAMGVVGVYGEGLAVASGLDSDVDLIMGTFSKSFGALGGFVSGDKKVIDYIKHHGSGHIFSASLPASICATVLASINIFKEEPRRREKLKELTQYLSQKLKHIGFNVQGSENVPIIHLILGHGTLAFAAYNILLKRGVYVNPIMPPAVPPEEAGFRISLMANHEAADIDKAIAEFTRLYQEINQ
ncbi:aminotransferase class I/II-fold pyridoxal phosphate-dependent enzyme [Pseudoalteromonas sp. J010]|uniref:aminotransferase class I/II-fold pyridoxal phosphate-dependent enzyme n=1 Tax=Pseudoalteromonas sp. J010 TaxID=998465 RepID=UPI000F64CDF3|nr:aminotransferase class I/II-fold pyridoxal phosphate-dependent enzyme [Pseudoalteromonas sp. J010]RRS10046.1 aminotransferase class I/II-fold pyridoxal phosphate-dependent enzyme [Pseudoalteromonas sp. J010]